MTTEADLRELSEKATPGRWYDQERYTTPGRIWATTGVDDDGDQIAEGPICETRGTRYREDLAFIVACVNYVRDMLASQDHAPSAGANALARAQGALRRLQEGAALALAIVPEEGPAADFLAAIHREAVRGLLASDDVTNEADHAPSAGAIQDRHRFGAPPEPVVNPSEAWCDAYADWYYQGRG